MYHRVETSLLYQNPLPVNLAKFLFFLYATELRSLADQFANVYLLIRVVHNAEASIMPLLPTNLAEQDHGTNSLLEKYIQGGCQGCALMEYIPGLQ